MAQAEHDEVSDLDSRIEELERRIEEDPTNAELHKELGNIFHRSRAYHLALAEYRTSIRIDPSYYPAAYNIGNTLYEMGEHLPAIVAWQRALILNPELEQAIYNVGFTYYQMGTTERDKDRRRRHFEDAIQNFRRAMDVDGTNPDTHLHLGLSFYELEKYDRAVDCYRAALEISPKDPAAHYNMGNVCYEKGEVDPSFYEQALEHYKQASKFDPSDLKSRNNIADCYLRLGKPKKARKQIQKVLEEFPDYLPAHCTLGEIFSEEGNPQAAIGEFEMVLALDEDEHGILHKYAGRALLKEYERLLEERPDDPDLYLRLGRAHKVLGLAYGDPQSLLAAVDALRRAGGAGTPAFLELAEVFIRLRRYEEALAAADKALDYDPASVCAMSLKAEVFCRTGDRDRAVESLQALRRQRFS